MNWQQRVEKLKALIGVLDEIKSYGAYDAQEIAAELIQDALEQMVAEAESAPMQTPIMFGAAWNHGNLPKPENNLPENHLYVE